MKKSTKVGVTKQRWADCEIQFRMTCDSAQAVRLGERAEVMASIIEHHIDDWFLCKNAMRALELIAANEDNVMASLNCEFRAWVEAHRSQSASALADASQKLIESHWPHKCTNTATAPSAPRTWQKSAF